SEDLRVFTVRNHVPENAILLDGAWQHAGCLSMHSRRVRLMEGLDACGRQLDQDSRGPGDVRTHEPHYWSLL
ncbi:hypothetical protein V5799_004312, partial [Amblyomma americanum]